MTFLDKYLFECINGVAGQWFVLDNIGVFCAIYLEYILWLWLIVFLVKDHRKYWRMVMQAIVAALIVRFILVELFRLFYFRPRPFVYHKVNLLINYSPLAVSFPSGHASFYFALSTIIYSYHKKIGMLFYAVTTCIVLGRVFVGIHWPSDILGGAVFGIGMGLVLSFLFKKIAVK